ncbi:MAG TPA: hypothetical protein VGO47_03255, partial [Chlamydiales bacterium]|nr:hypothetical protein [Chlamydiales bacterium]
RTYVTGSLRVDDGLVSTLFKGPKIWQVHHEVSLIMLFRHYLFYGISSFTVIDDKYNLRSLRLRVNYNETKWVLS